MWYLSQANGIDVGGLFPQYPVTGNANSMRPHYLKPDMNFSKSRSKVLDVHDRSLTGSSHYWGHADL
jgi:hypothetical protein